MDYVWYIKIMNLKVYSQLFVAIEVLVPFIYEISKITTAFVFPKTFFQAVSSRLRPTVPQTTLDFDVGFLFRVLKKLDNVDFGHSILEKSLDFHDIIFFICFYFHLCGDDREESK